MDEKAKQLFTILKQYKVLKENYNDLIQNKPNGKWNKETRAWEYPKDYDELMKQFNYLQESFQNQEHIFEKEIKKLFPIEIKNPKDIMACRVETGYGGKFLDVDINNLNKIQLSEKKEMGTIHTRYKIGCDGVGKLSKNLYTYRIIRKDKKVYWCYDTYLLINNYLTKEEE